MIIVYFISGIIFTIVLLSIGVVLGIVISDDEKRKQIVKKVNKHRKQTAIFNDKEKTLADVVKEKKPQGEVYFDSFLEDVQNKRI